MSDLQSILEAELPSCALPCVVQSAHNSTCHGLNLDCICSNPDFMGLANACIAQSCSARGLLSTQNVTSTHCGIKPQVNQSHMPIIIIFLVVAVVAFLLRAASKITTKAQLWWDDFAVLLATMATITLSTIALSLTSLGFGHDVWSVPLDNVAKILRGLYIIGILYTMARYLVRACILLFYLRIFTTSKARIITRVTLTFIIAEGLSFTLPTIFQCSPIKTFWLQWDGEFQGKCVDLQSMLWVSISLCIVGDLWIIVYPIVLISRLQLKPRDKIRVSIMLAVGIVVTALNIARLPTLHRATSSANPTRDNIPITILSAVENDIGILCACLPGIHSLISSLYAKRRAKRGSSATSGPDRPGQYDKCRTDIIPLGRPETDGYHSDQPAIRLTTIVDQSHKPYDPRSDLHTDDLDVTSTRQGGVNVQAWA